MLDRKLKQSKIKLQDFKRYSFQNHLFMCEYHQTGKLSDQSYFSSTRRDPVSPNFEPSNDLSITATVPKIPKIGVVFCYKPHLSNNIEMKRLTLVYA